MKRIFGLLIIIVILVVGIVWVYKHQSKKNPSGNSNNNSGGQQASGPDLAKGVFVFNPSTQSPLPQGMAYGSQTDVLYIWDLKNNKQIAKIDTNLKPDISHNYTLSLNNLVYFYNSQDHMVETIDTSGKISKLAFTQSSGDPSNSFVISPDQKKIVWTSNTFAPKKAESDIWMADLDGNNRQPLALRNYTTPTYVKLFRWADRLYFGEEPSGIGGYILFSGLHNLWRFDINAGTYGKIIDPGSSGYVTDVTADGFKIAYFTGALGKQKLIMKDVNLGQQQTFVSSEGAFRGGGDAVFSPDDKVLVFDEGHWNPDSEHLRTERIDLTTGQKTVIYDNVEQQLRTVRFVDNNTLLMTDPGGSKYFLINAADGSNVRQINLEQ